MTRKEAVKIKINAYGIHVVIFDGILCYEDSGRSYVPYADDLTSNQWECKKLISE